VALEYIEFKDPHGNSGWGLTTWQPDEDAARVHTSDPSAPPNIIRCCMRDWKEAAEWSGIKARKEPMGVRLAYRPIDGRRYRRRW
jgi:hypothetical protein